MNLEMRIRSVLTESLRRDFGTSGEIVSLNRTRSDYTSSFEIEELEVVFENGNSLSLIYKNLGRDALQEAARQTKHPFLYNPEREIEVYRSILSQTDLGTAKLYGALVDKEADHYWLFIEKVPGLELYQLGEFETWLQVSRWLATLHNEFADRGEELASRAPLLSYDRGFYERWPHRATTFMRDQSRTVRTSFNRLVLHYDQIIDRLLALSTTLLHGDFFASNILAQKQKSGLRICPVDWDMAAVGPASIDLAALTSGNWTENQKVALVRAYLEVSESAEKRQQSLDELLTELNWCQLHLSLQWLGWSPDWSPPEEHQQDWLQQALVLADKLKL